MAEKPVLTAVAYVSDASDLPLIPGDILVCNASDAAARAGSTRRDTLTELVRRKVSVWSRPGLHATISERGSRELTTEQMAALAKSWPKRRRAEPPP